MDKSVLVERLGQYQQQIDADIEKFCQTFIKQSKAQFTAHSGQVVEAYCAILERGGKRLRGALVMTAYEMLGGGDRALSLQLARVAELIHTYLLIIDDICDRSAMRRGGPAAHILLLEQHRAQHLQGGSEHFGMAQAINAALLGLHTTELQVIELPVSDTKKLEVLHDLHQALLTTVHGQINDMYNEVAAEVSEFQVMAVLGWKTAHYSFMNPLRMGALLAGADPLSIAVLESYGQAVGLAFQVSDDILGTFGNTFESGKSSMDDLKEGKITLLISKALERATPEQKRLLRDNLGNQQLSPLQHEQLKQIIEDTGSLDYARKVATRYADRAIQALEEAPTSWSAEGVQFLRELAAYVVERRS